MTDKTLVYLTPQRRDPESEIAFLAGIVEVEDAQGVATLEEVLPLNWNGKFTTHLYEITDTFDLETNILWPKMCFSSKGITHVIVLEGPSVPDVEPIYFNGDVLKGNSAVCYYKGGTGQFAYIHCGKCARYIVSWIVQKQEDWEIASRSKPENGSTRH